MKTMGSKTAPMSFGCGKYFGAQLWMEVPVIMLETMSGRITSWSIRIRISPGKPKYCLSRLDRLAYSLTAIPKQAPGREREDGSEATFPN